jgi:hypothetical protein
VPERHLGPRIALLAVLLLAGCSSAQSATSPSVTLGSGATTPGMPGVGGMPGMPNRPAGTTASTTASTTGSAAAQPLIEPVRRGDKLAMQSIVWSPIDQSNLAGVRVSRSMLGSWLEVDEYAASASAHLCS